MTFLSLSCLRIVAICWVLLLAVSLADVVDVANSTVISAENTTASPGFKLNSNESNDSSTKRDSEVNLSIFPAATNPATENVTAQQLTSTKTDNSTTNSTKLTINPFGALESPNPNLSLLPNTGRFPTKNTTGIRGPKLCRPNCSSITDQEETDADPSKHLSWYLHFDVPSQLIIGHRMAEVRYYYCRMSVCCA